VYSVNLLTNKFDELQNVYHSIKFKNSTGMSLSAGPVVVTSSQDAFMAQESVRATPEGEDALVQLTRAMDISCVLQLTSHEVKERKNGFFSSSQ